MENNRSNIAFSFITPILGYIIITLVAGCSATKFVPADKELLKQNKVILNEIHMDKELLLPYMKQKANKKILGLNMHLAMYNLSSSKRNGWLSRWLKTIGEEPVIYDPFLKQKTTKQLQLYFINKGYRDAIVKDTVFRKKQKVRICYELIPSQPYLIDTINYDITDSLIKHFVLSDTSKSFLKQGALFDLTSFENERMRIEYNLKSQGFYNFNKDYILFKADTTGQKKKNNVTLEIKQNKQRIDINQFITTPHPQYKVNDISIFLDYDGKKVLAKDSLYFTTLDTIIYKNISFIYQNNEKIKPNSILQSVFIECDSLYSISNVKETYNHLSALNLFRFINITFNEVNKPDTNGWGGLINCQIQLNTYAFQSFSVELEGTNSSGDIGGALNFGYQHKNLFKGAEVMNFNIRGATEAVKERYNGRIHNTLEFGTEMRIRFPKFILPINSRNFIKLYNPKTTVTLAYNLQKRPDYTRSIANTSFGYIWQARSKSFTHIINPIEINYVYLPPSPELSNFIDRIKDTYLENSFKDHFISTTNYSLIYNSQNFARNIQFLFFRLNTETGGNILSGVNTILNRPKIDDAYNLLGIRYAQYIKGDIDFRYYQPLNETDKVVFRLFCGVGVPYGNSNAIPFEKKYFAGGANSIRAWQVRTLGPGSNKDITTTYPNSLGDIKLEGNFEYRFDLFWLIKGALFVDVGNIWAVNDLGNREGAIFKPNLFYKQLAIGTGIGTRFDFSFFVFRLDVGFKTHDPSEVPGNKWIFNRDKIYSNDYNINIGIGYPF